MMVNSHWLFYNIQSPSESNIASSVLSLLMGGTDDDDDSILNTLVPSSKLAPRFS